MGGPDATRPGRAGHRRGPGFGQTVFAAVVVLSGLSILLARRPACRRSRSGRSRRPTTRPGRSWRRPGGVLPAAEYERRDMRFGTIFLGGVGTLVTLAGMLGLALWLYPRSVPDKQIATPLPSFPAPRLQAQPTVRHGRFAGAAAWPAATTPTGWTASAASSTCRSPTRCRTWRGAASRTGRPVRCRTARSRPGWNPPRPRPCRRRRDEAAAADASPLRPRPGR